MERGEYLDQSGEKFTGFGLYFGAEELTFGGRLQYCWNQAVDFVRLVRLSLQMLITGEAGFSDMSGPVASSPPSPPWASSPKALRPPPPTSPTWRPSSP